MSERRIAIEYKNQHLGRPMLNQIYGTVLANGGADVIVVRCRSVASTVVKAIEEGRYAPTRIVIKTNDWVYGDTEA